jgi:hypothetical protein
MMFITPGSRVSRHRGPRAAITRQVFTASATWQKPHGYGPNSLAHIQAWGAGGSGSAVSTAIGNSGAGGGGGYNEVWLPLSVIPNTVKVTIGQGGTAVSVNGSSTFTASGNQGGDTTFGSVMAGYGGSGGFQASSGGFASDGGGGGGQLSAGVIGTDTTNDALGGLGGQPLVFNGSTMSSDGCNSSNSGDLPAWWGGGGGGGLSVGGGSGVSTLDGNGSTWGGAGGAAGSSTTPSVGTAQTSLYGGNGGTGAGVVTGPATAGNGSAPGGGGGGAAVQTGACTSGAGASGQLIVTVYSA